MSLSVVFRCIISSPAGVMLVTWYVLASSCVSDYKSVAETLIMSKNELIGSRFKPVRTAFEVITVVQVLDMYENKENTPWSLQLISHL